MYTDEAHYTGGEVKPDDAVEDLGSAGKARAFLFRLVQSHSYAEEGFRRSKSWKKELLEEIELFTKCVMEDDEA